MKTSPVCRFVGVVAVIGICMGMFGCAATQLAIEKRNLDVQTKMSDTIFLDPVGPDKKTVFIDVKNTSDKEVDIASDIARDIAGRGYKVVQDPNQAHYLLQANILSVGKMDPSAPGIDDPDRPQHPLTQFHLTEIAGIRQDIDLRTGVSIPRSKRIFTFVGSRGPYGLSLKIDDQLFAQVIVGKDDKFRCIRSC